MRPTGAGGVFVATARGRHRRVRGQVDRRRPGGDRREGDPIPIVFLHPSDPVRDGLVEEPCRARREPDRRLRCRATSSPSNSSSTRRSCRGCIGCSRSSTRPTRERRDSCSSSTRAPPRSCNDRSSWTFASLERAGPEAHLPIAASRRGRRRLPPVVEPSAELLGADDPARQAGAGSRSRRTARSGSSRVRSSRTGSISPDRTSRRALRRQHPPGHGAGRPARRGDSERRVRDQSQDRQQARHQGAAGHDHPGGRGLPVAERTPRGATQRGSTRTAAPTPDLEVHRGRRDARRRGDRLGRAHGALLLVPGQQASAEPRRAGQGRVGRGVRSSSRCRTSCGHSRPSPNRRSRHGAAGLAERNQDFHRLLDREPFVSQLSYLDAAGKEQVRDLTARAESSRQRRSTSPGRPSSLVRALRSAISAPSTSCAGRSRT